MSKRACQYVFPVCNLNSMIEIIEKLFFKEIF